ncbi:MAG: hypothetical protein ACP5FK_11325 [bacterium]
MLKFLYILNLISFLFFPLNSSVWIKNYGVPNYNEIGTSVTTIDSVYYYITGTTNTPGLGFYDGYLVKINSLGDTIFTCIYGGNGEDRFKSVTIFQDTLLVLAGWSNSFSSGDLDIYLVCIDQDGDTVWERTYGESGDDRSYQVIQSTDGQIIVAGGSETSPGGDLDVFLIKLNQNGDTIWTSRVGGPGNEMAYAVCQLPNGNIVTCGYTQSWGKGFKDILLIGFSDQGDSIWARTYGGGFDDWANSIINFDNAIYIGGATESYGYGFWDNYIIKCNFYGDSIWTKTYGGNYREEIRQMISHPSGDIWFTGWTESFGSGYTDILLTSIDSSGDENWTRYYGSFSYERGNALISTPEFGCILVGEVWDLHWDDYNLYLIKTDSGGFTTGVVEQISSLINTADGCRIQNFLIKPGWNILRFNLSLDINCQIRIYDLSGRELFSEKLLRSNQHDYQVKVNFRSTGLFFYIIGDQTGDQFGKIMVTE